MRSPDAENQKDHESGLPTAASGPDPSSFGGHPYTPDEIALGYGTDHDPRFTQTTSFEEQHERNMHLLGLIRDEPAWALNRILLAERLERDIPKHADAIDGYDGSLMEHGDCAVCEVLNRG